MSCKFRKDKENEEKRECPLCALKDSPWMLFGTWVISGMNLIFALRNFIRTTVRLEDYLDDDFDDDEDYDEYGED